MALELWYCPLTGRRLGSRVLALALQGISTTQHKTTSVAEITHQSRPIQTRFQTFEQGACFLQM